MVLEYGGGTFHYFSLIITKIEILNLNIFRVLQNHNQQQANHHF